MKLRTLSTSTLRATLLVFRQLGIYRAQARAIEDELALRAWADAIAARLSEPACVWTARGGRS